jgi:Ion channel
VTLPQRWLFRRWQPSLVLLVVQLSGVLLYPFLEGSTGRAILSLFGLVVLLLAVRAVEATPAMTRISIFLGVPIVILLLVEVTQPLNESLELVSSVLLAAFYFYTCYALIRYMFHDWIVTPDELYATGATFTVVAWAFAYVYLAVQIVWPGSFTSPTNAGPQGWFELLYLSFTNLTSVGLSDITPVLPNARSIVMIEQVAGVMYVALVISRVVGLTVARQRELADARATAVAVARDDQPAGASTR